MTDQLCWRRTRALARSLDPDRFFLNVRPYFKPHVVCGTEYRGVNAGDFAAVSEIDLALGLCDVGDPFYQRILAEKYPYLPPEDQPGLRTPPAPSCATASARHDSTRRPFSSTVHEPHCPWSQPFFGAIADSQSRNASSNVVRRKRLGALSRRRG